MTVSTGNNKADKIRRQLFTIMEENDRVLARVVDLFLLLWISLNVFVVLLESVAELNEEYGIFFQQFDIV